MLVEQVTETCRNTGPPAQARLSAQGETSESNQGSKRPVKEPNSSQVAELVADVQKNLKIMHNVDLQFSVHEASGKIKVTVTEESSGEIIREIPPEEVLRLAAKFDEMVGMIFDESG